MSNPSEDPSEDPRIAKLIKKALILPPILDTNKIIVYGKAEVICELAEGDKIYELTFHQTYKPKVQKNFTELNRR